LGRCIDLERLFYPKYIYTDTFENQKNFLKNRLLRPEGWSLIGDFSHSEIFWITGRNRQQQLPSKDWRFLTCIKKRPALVLFEEKENIVVLGITSNPKMEGVLLTKKEGVIKDSIIKLNYIFTISEKMVEKNLFSISEEKKIKVKEELISRIR